MTIHLQALTVSPLDANGYADDVTSTGASYVLAATSPGDGMAHIVTILGNAATNHSAKTFTIVGTDHDGYAISESIAGPNGVATVSSTLYFKTVTSVTPSASTGADTFDIGWALACIAPSIRMNLEGPAPFNVGIGCTVSSGSPTFTVSYSFDRSAWFATSISGATASAAGALTTPCRYLRLSFAAAGGINMTVVQADGNRG